MSDDLLPTQRLHPLTVILNLFGLIRAQILPLAVVAVQTFRIQSSWANAAALLLIIALSGWAWLSWYRFTYRIEAADLVIEGGIFRRFRRNIPLHRIQDISISQTFLQRLIGLNSAAIETAGGNSNEGELVGLNMRQIRNLRALFAGFEHDGEEVFEEEALIPATPLFEMSMGRVLALGLLNPSSLWLLSLVILWQIAYEWLAAHMSRWTVAMLDTASAHSSIALIASGVIFLLICTIAAGVARAGLTYAGFRLSEQDGRFRLRKGLFAHSDTALVLRAVQMAWIRSSPMERLTGWRSLRLQTIGGSDGPSGRLVVAPLARDAEVTTILAHAGLPAPGAQDWRRLMYRHPMAQAMRNFAPIVAVSVAVGWFFPWGYAALTLVPLMLIRATIRSSRCRLALNEGDIQVRGGALTSSHAILPYTCTQSVSLTQGPIQRLLGSVTLHLNVAGASGISVRDIRPDAAQEIIATIEARGWQILPAYRSKIEGAGRAMLGAEGRGAGDTD